MIAWLSNWAGENYNTLVVLAGVSMLSLASGVVGCFMLLRKRALMADALSHATLPGIGLAFMVMVWMGGSGKSLPGLLLGATVTGVLGALIVLALRSYTRLKEDASLGIVLSVFFGTGVCLLGWIQKMKEGSAAGLESFIYGKTASMVAQDAWLIGGAGAVCVVTCVLFYKEFRLICFDTGFARSQGWPVTLIDGLLMTLSILVVVIGLQAVGLILVIALLIIPPAAARFWTDRLDKMILVSGFIGLFSGVSGALISANHPKIPSGAIIVLMAIVLFVLSMMLAPNRGVIARLVRHRGLSARIARQQFLRTLFELTEEASAGPVTPGVKVPFKKLLGRRSWTKAQLSRQVRQGLKEGTLAPSTDDGVQLSHTGLVEAARLTRNHRLWEIYLITHADIAASHVDRDAHVVEHVLGEEMVARLELLLEPIPARVVPASPHGLAPLNAPGSNIAGKGGAA
jgi:manganese/zinc/iron transport system permease protein